VADLENIFTKLKGRQKQNHSDVMSPGVGPSKIYVCLLTVDDFMWRKKEAAY
jgi:hypothetical protein